MGDPVRDDIERVFRQVLGPQAEFSVQSLPDKDAYEVLLKHNQERLRFELDKSEWIRQQNKRKYVEDILGLSE